MKVITLLNEKGGVAKTSLAVSLAALFAKMGYRVLLLDGDSQGHTTVWTGLEKQPGMFHIVANDADFQDVLMTIPASWYGGSADEASRLAILPGDKNTAQLTRNGMAFNLVERMEEVRSIFEFVFVDTNPSISDLHTTFYLLSDYLVYPTQCTRQSIDGVLTSIRHLEYAREAANQRGMKVGEVLGVAPTMYIARQLVQHQSLDWLQRKYGEQYRIFTPITRRSAWEKAESRRIPVYMYNQRDRASTEIARLAGEIRMAIGL